MRQNKTEHHFLHIEQCGRLSYLTALPGQTLQRKPVIEGIAVKGCEKYRKSFTTGSIFATTTLKRAHHGCAGFYKVEDLYYLGNYDPHATLFSESVRQELIAEYQQFIRARRESDKVKTYYQPYLRFEGESELVFPDRLFSFQAFASESDARQFIAECTDYSNCEVVIREYHEGDIEGVNILDGMGNVV